jgi:mono/diheme cytochrome c family protein
MRLRNTTGLITGAALILTGCGNQMMRQPSINPLDSPRAAAPGDAVPVASGLAPFDARPVSSSDTGYLPHGMSEFAQLSIPEPNLPAPNLSDNARNEPTPHSVDILKNPLPNNSEIISNGHTLFLNRCVQCHNSSGYGYGPVGGYLVPHPPDLGSQLVQKRTNGAIFWHITMGQGKMPAFRTWTTPYQRWELTSFVRSLSHSNPSIKLSDTLDSPYPVYGETGFEIGNKTNVVGVSQMIPRIQQNIRKQHFEQSSNGGWKSAP